MRVLVFFLVAIGGLLLPLALVVLLLLLSPFPYERFGPAPVSPPPTASVLASQFAPDSRATPISSVGEVPCTSGMRANWEDGSSVGVAAFASAETAAQALEALFRSPGYDFRSRTNALRYLEGAGVREDGSPLKLFAWTEADWLFWIEARGAEAFDRRLSGLPFLRPRARKPFADRLLGENILWLFGGLLGYIAVLVPVWTRTASWAAVVPATSGVAPVGIDELRRRILALDHPQHPIRVGVEGPWITVEWKLADARWCEILGAAGVHTVHRLRLRLDADDHTVRAQDHQGTVRWATGTLGLAPEISWSVQRGIVFADVHFEAHPSLAVEQGTVVFRPAHGYSYNLNEIKAPVIRIIADSGWTYRPVLSFLSRALFG